VAQFVFSSPSGSYASRTGRPDNIGVVGVAVFEEARRWRPEPILRRGLPLPAGRRPKRPCQCQPHRRLRQQVAGPSAGYRPRCARAVLGARYRLRARQPQPAQVLQLRYDSARNLRARGILVDSPSRLPREPQAFPNRYVPDPPAR
jgi:hypothetical protein